jgi:hypothetical protein
MDTIGLDLHKRESQLCIGLDDGQIIEQRIATTRERFTAELGARSRARILLEASTESEWVARHLESLGHEVIVADPNFAPMYATRSRRTKTDRRDARTLMEACRLGRYRVAHACRRRDGTCGAELAVREALVRTRTRYIAVAKTLVRRDGLRVAASESHLVAQRIAALELSAHLSASCCRCCRSCADQRADRGGGSPDRRVGERRSGDATTRDGAVDRANHGECDRRDGGRRDAVRLRASVRSVLRARAGERSSGEKRASVALRRPAIHACGICSWKPAGGFFGRRARRRRRCGHGG